MKLNAKYVLKRRFGNSWQAQSVYCPTFSLWSPLNKNIAQGLQQEPTLCGFWSHDQNLFLHSLRQPRGKCSVAEGPVSFAQPMGQSRVEKLKTLPNVTTTANVLGYPPLTA